MKVLVLIVTIALAALAQQTGNAEKRFDIATAPTTDSVSMAISPDGKKIVYVAVSGSRRYGLWLRRLDSDSAELVKGAENVALPFPFWSPDSRSVGFFAGDRIQRFDIETKELRTVLEGVPGGRGATWNKDGMILFAGVSSPLIFAVSTDGEMRSAITRLETPRHAEHAMPYFLPDGRHFLYYVSGAAEVRGVYVGQIDKPETKRLMDAETAAIYAAPGQILFARQNTLFAQAFDPATLKLGGKPAPIADRVPWIGHAAAVSASAAGHLVYRSGVAAALSMDTNDKRPTIKETVGKEFTWFDRAGKALGTVGSPTDIGGAELSPDGRQVAFDRVVEGSQNIWLLDTENGAFTQFSSGMGAFPVWSPDGRRIAFASNRSGEWTIWEKPVNVWDAQETGLLSAQEQKFGVVPRAWPPDGHSLLMSFLFVDFMSRKEPQPLMGFAHRTIGIWRPENGSGSFGVLRIPQFAPIPQSNSGAGRGSVARPAFGDFPQVSPDGKWVAIQTHSDGNPMEIIITPFLPRMVLADGSLLPDANSSREGTIAFRRIGRWPRWSLKGDELFYVAPDGMLMAVPIDLMSSRPGTPVPLFTPPMLGEGQFPPQYAVAKDGRFLVIAVHEVESPIHVIENWKGQE